MASTEPVFAYLGPAGTYTDEAARAFAARLGIDEPNLFECASFDEVFDCVDRGKCEFGVVAKENSLEGSVTATLDNFSFKSSATILGEEVIDIHHCLVMHPDAKIEVLDSAAATVTEATMVENAVAIRDAGCTLDEAVTWLEAEKATNNIFFTVGNLDYLIKGGRIGKVSGRAANLLGIKPMILFKDGEIFSGGVARGRQKSFEKALEQLMNYLDANGGTPDDYRLIVGYGYDEEEGRRLWLQTRAALRAKYPAAACEVGLLQIGCTIAVHTGPYALGMGVMRRWKKQQ